MIPITGHTKLTCLLGSPVAHSISPMMHNTSFSALGLDYVYTAFDISPQNLPDAVHALKLLNVRGYNLTMPHKTAILPFMDELTPAAKLAQAVKNTLPALAEAMENLRKNLLLLCYQLGYLRKGKERLNISLNMLRPALTQYNQLAKDIRDKTKERRSLLSEKKALSAVHVFRHRELAAKIAALTEDLEELRSEKNLLLASLAYTEEDAADKFPKDIAAMEQSLKRLEEQEQKYSAELDAALNEYAGLREQAQSVDPVQLYEARRAIRPGKEQEAESRAQQVYGEKYNPLLMFDSKKAVSRMLHEDMERQAVRRMMRQAQKEQQTLQKKKSEQER